MLYNPQITVRGRVLGPSFQLSSRQFDIGSIYVGQTIFLDVTCTNIGVISGKVIFQKALSVFDGIVKISPRAETITPGDAKTFKIKFLGKRAGRFVEQANFRVKNGEKLSFAIQGTINALEIVLEPPILEFDAIPICVPHMQTMMIRNDLPFEIDVQIEIENSGTDKPLQFLEFFQIVKGFKNEPIPAPSPLTASSSSEIENDLTESCSSLLTGSAIKTFMESAGKLEQLREGISAAQDGIRAIYDQVDKYLEGTEIVSDIIQHIFDGKFKVEMEKPRIVTSIVDLLLNSLNTAEVSFQHLNWILPENPCEIEVSKQLVKLPPKGEHCIKVYLTANFIGKFARNLKMKLMISDLKPKQGIDETIVNVPLWYESRTAELVIHNQKSSIMGFAESEIQLEVLVENVSNVDGFFTFHRFEDVDTIVKCDENKFRVAAMTQNVIDLRVLPLKSGVIVKFMNFVALGSNRKFPFSIECKSIPPDIIIRPSKICDNEVDVLLKHDTRIFIENRSSAKARIFLKLENEKSNFEVEPCGGILSSKQILMITLSKYFTDPGEYQDTLIVEVINSKTIVSM